MLKGLKDNKKGVVFITVLMIIIVMMVLAISILSMNVSQVLVTESEAKRIQAQIIAFGAIAFAFANQSSGTPGNSIIYSTTLDGQTFDTNISIGNPGSGINGTSQLNISVSY